MRKIWTPAEDEIKKAISKQKNKLKNCAIPVVIPAVCPVCGHELTFFDAEGYCHKCRQPR